MVFRIGHGFWSEMGQNSVMFSWIVVCSWWIIWFLIKFWERKARNGRFEKREIWNWCVETLVDLGLGFKLWVGLVVGYMLLITARFQNRDTMLTSKWWATLLEKEKIKEKKWWARIGWSWFRFQVMGRSCGWKYVDHNNAFRESRYNANFEMVSEAFGERKKKKKRKEMMSEGEAINSRRKYIICFRSYRILNCFTLVQD